MHCTLHVPYSQINKILLELSCCLMWGSDALSLLSVRMLFVCVRMVCEK